MGSKAPGTLHPPSSPVWPEGCGEAPPVPKQGVPQSGSRLGSRACLGVWDGLEQREARGRETGSVAPWLRQSSGPVGQGLSWGRGFGVL